ncbi:T9SS type A sorting domain-containing protein [Fluviicola sp.]|uniref:T9SS type A sorting domain-containing protein n=1 Tax=Fluviicola sp. TaxID=1917219 RepID=UPI003D2C0687
MRKGLISIKFTLLTILFTVFLSTVVNAQCSVVSSSGYTVNVAITPKNIVVSSTNCPWGYNYNVNFDYNISITGPNASAQYTLQALIYCVNGQINGAYSLPLNGGTGNATTTTNPAIPHNGTAYGYNAPYVNCTNATIATMNCTSIDLIIQGPGIPYQVINCAVSTAPPTNLPVDFLFFDGEKKDSGNLLTWAVESEQRNDYFTIETSSDGENWNELTKVKGAGTSTEAKTYTFLDAKNGSQSTYYKLSQTDLDGTRNELALKYIPMNESDFNMYPNPTSDSKVHFTFSDNSETSTVILRNEVGQVVFQQDLVAVSKSGKTSYYNSELDLGQSAGIYLVEVQSGDQLVNRSKLVIR